MYAARVPTYVEVADELGLPLDTPGLERRYEAAVIQQAAACYTDPYDAQLAEALVKRVANLVAAKAHTLGYLETTDYGVAITPTSDPLVLILESPRSKTPEALA